VIATLSIVLLLTLLCIGVPMLKLEYRCRVSRSHCPMAQELWLQEGSLIYIESVDEQGVHILTLDPSRGQLLRWVDSWPAWRERQRVRCVWFTGRRAALTISE